MNFWKYFMLLLITLAVITGCTQGESDRPNPETGTTPAATGSGAAGSSAAAKAKPEPVVAPRVVEAPAGTELEVVLVDALNSGRNKAGDAFTANLAAPLVVDGTTILNKGEKLQGRVVDAEGSGRVKGRGNMRLVLTGVVRDDKVIPIVTKTRYFEAESTKGRDAAAIGGAAGVGAAIGAIAGGKKGAGTGAAVGGAAGTGAVLATKGKEVEFRSESKLKFTLEKAAGIPMPAK